MTERPFITGITPRFWVMALVLLCALSDVTIGQEGTGRRAYEAIPGKYASTTPASTKVSASLRAVMDKMEAQGMTRRNARELGASTLSNPLVRVDEEGSIQTYIHVDTLGDVEKAVLETYDVSIELTNEALGIIQAWVPFDRIDELAQLAFVTRITPPSYATPRVGSVTTEGDTILRADALRALGFDGRGVKVGVISDGVDSRATAQASGDLPSNITIVTFAGSGDEGTAMLEIVHDLAPGAELGFCGVATSLEMIQCVNDLAGVFGAHIIVDDLGFFLEPYFEDGPVAEKVAGAVANGVVYVSAAGNDANTHYQGQYVDSGDGVGSHQISPGNSVFNVAGDLVAIFLQWSNPFGSSGDNYDLCLSTETPAECALFNTPLDGNDDPIEFALFRCATGCGLQVRLVSGSAQTLEVFVVGGTLSSADGVAADTIFGHPAVPGVLATGAISASDPDHNELERFSSWGPSTIFFPSPETRQKPDVTAIDGVSVTGAGGFPSPFFGTSASAPHVAGVAALVKNVSPTATAAKIVAALKSSAVDLGTPGPDNMFGAGRIDALAVFPIGGIVTPNGDVTINQGKSINFTGTGTDPGGNLPLTFVWDFGGGAPNSTQEDPGNVRFNTAGTFTVTFTVTNSLGLADLTPATRIITVNAPPGGVINTPTGNVTITQGESVNFTGTGTDPDGPLPLTFVWDFGGGAPNSPQEDPGNVRFNTAGTFTVTFTVTDSLGLADPTPATRTITVNQPPSSSSSGGGGCTLTPGAAFNPVLVALLGWICAYLSRKALRRRGEINYD